MKKIMKPWPSLAPYGKTLSMPGGELFYYDSEKNNADGKPALVLVHGLGDEADTWRHVFPILTDAGYRVIAPDLPGFGRSQWKGRINLCRHCMTVLHLIAETGAANTERPAVLAGSSLGAGVVEMMAGMRPDLFRSIMLIDGCFPFSGSMDSGFYLLALPLIGKRWYRSFRKNHDIAWKSLYPYYGSLDAMSEADRDFLRERVIARVESPNQERGYLSTLRSMGNFFLLGKETMTEKIKSYPGRIGIFWGEDDRILPKEKADPFRNLRPDADFTLIADAGHLPHQEKPQETAAKMLSFLKEKKHGFT